MHKSVVFTFGLLTSPLVMLSAMLLFNNYVAMAQRYNNYGDSYSQYPIEDTNMNAEQGHLKDSLYVQ